LPACAQTYLLRELLDIDGAERHLVARLGVLAPPHGIGSTRIQGDRYRCERAWGHLLNAHYLNPTFPWALPQRRLAHPLAG
jgi:hypothetical protein